MINNFCVKRFTAILCVVAMLILVSLLGGCTDENTQVATDVNTDSAVTDNTDYDILTEAVTTAADDNDKDSDKDSLPDVLAEYSPEAAYDADSNKVSMNFAFGSAYSTYGGALKFDDDGGFRVYMGADGGEGSNTGTYKVISDKTIRLCYDNGFEDDAEILSVDNGIIREVKVSFGDIFFVVFKG